jgi:hypothetical protein
MDKSYIGIQTRIRADTPMNTTLLLALYCHLNNPIARTVLLPESDNYCAYTPAIPIIVVPISLRPKHDQAKLYSLEYNPVAGTVLLVLEYIERGKVLKESILRPWILSGYKKFL